MTGSCIRIIDFEDPVGSFADACARSFAFRITRIRSVCRPTIRRSFDEVSPRKEKTKSYDLVFNAGDLGPLPLPGAVTAPPYVRSRARHRICPWRANAWRFCLSRPMQKALPGHPDGRPGRAWCEGGDLNPHVVDTRTSNVPVCQFQHPRIGTVRIIPLKAPFCQYFFVAKAKKSCYTGHRRQNSRRAKEGPPCSFR